MQVVRESQKIKLSDLKSDVAFWFGFICGQIKSVNSKTFEFLQQLSYYKESEIINSTVMNFFIMLLVTNSSRFNEVFNYFQESLNPEIIKTMLTDPEINSLNEIFFISENSENFKVVQEEPQIFQEDPIYFAEEPNYPGVNPNYYGEKQNYYGENPNYFQGNPYDTQVFGNFNSGVFGNPNNIQTEVECVICIEKFPISDFIPFNNCACICDAACFNKFLDIEIQGRKFPINCPMCKTEVSEQDIVQRVDTKARDNYFQFNFRKFVGEHSSEYSSCPTPDCQNVFIAENESHYGCPLCKKEYCLRCKVDYHKGITCEKYQEKEIDKKTQSADHQFLNFVKGTNYKQCPNCKFWVERSSGCPHMTCRCRYQFCYTCGGKYQACRCVGT